MTASSRIPGAGPVRDLFEFVLDRYPFCVGRYHVLPSQASNITGAQCPDEATCTLRDDWLNDAADITEVVVEFLREHGIELDR